MTNKEEKNGEKKEETTKKVLNKKMDELRKWFESLGDCVWVMDCMPIYVKNKKELKDN